MPNDQFGYKFIFLISVNYHINNVDTTTYPEVIRMTYSLRGGSHKIISKEPLPFFQFQTLIGML